MANMLNQASAASNNVQSEAALDSRMREMASHTQTLSANEKAELEAYAAEKWGFMKNIINIDAFFSTGAPGKTAASMSQWR
jgi:hypothetical protein